MDPWFNLREAAQMLGWRDWRTVSLWMHRAGIMPTRHEHDKRHWLLTREQVEAVRVYHEQHRRQSAEVRGDLLAQALSRIEALEARVRALEARQRPVAPLPLSLAPLPPVPAPALPVARRAVPTRKLMEVGLPAGLTLAKYAAEAHGQVPERTVKNWIEKGHIPIVTEPRYRLGNGVVARFVLDAEGMAAFYHMAAEVWQEREKFQPCPACPHLPPALPGHDEAPAD